VLYNRLFTFVLFSRNPVQSSWTPVAHAPRFAISCLSLSRLAEFQAPGCHARHPMSVRAEKHNPAMMLCAPKVHFHAFRFASPFYWSGSSKNNSWPCRDILIRWVDVALCVSLRGSVLRSCACDNDNSCILWWRGKHCYLKEQRERELAFAHKWYSITSTSTRVAQRKRQAKMWTVENGEFMHSPWKLPDARQNSAAAGLRQKLEVV